jgi:putative oxidoreductase
MNPTADPDRGLLHKGYDSLVWGGSWLQSLALLIPRVAWGWELYLSGYRHLHDVPTMVERFTKWGVPMPQLSVYVSGTTEMVGGILLFVGLGTRLISLPLLFNFIVAYLTASHAKLAQAFGAQSSGRLEGLENVIDDFAFPFFCLSLIMIAFGPGWISIDGLLKRLVWKRKRRSTSPAPPSP